MAGSAGIDYETAGQIGRITGQWQLGADISFRSDWYSDASVSRYSLIKGSTLVNLRGGFRTYKDTEVQLWVRNALDEAYLNLVTIQAGNSGAIYGQPGDPRTWGVTVRKSF